MNSWAGNLIRLARREKGLSQRDLAKSAGTSQAAISAYEAGRRVPSLETLARIVRSAGLDLRIRLEPLDDHDEWMARYESKLPSEVVKAWHSRDRELLAAADKERAPAGQRRARSGGRSKALK